MSSRRIGMAGAVVAAFAAVTLAAAGCSSGSSSSHTAKTSTTSAGSSSGGQAGSGGGGGSAGGSGTGASSTTPGAAKPVFTSTNANTAGVDCSSGSIMTDISITWTVTNATTVEFPSPPARSYGSRPATGANATFVDNGCTHRSDTIIAHGPGGSTSTTVSWFIRRVPLPTAKPGPAHQ